MVPRVTSWVDLPVGVAYGLELVEMTFTFSATGCFGVGAVESSVLFFVTILVWDPLLRFVVLDDGWCPG